MHEIVSGSGILLYTSFRYFGGGAYWSGRAARPLFAPNGQAVMFAYYFLPY